MGGGRRRSTSTHLPRVRSPHIRVEQWANIIGRELWEFGADVTRIYEVMQNFKDVKIETRDGMEMVNHLSHELEKLMKLKVNAVKAIAEAAQDLSRDYNYDQQINGKLTYNNAKLIKPPGPKLNATDIEDGYTQLGLIPNSNFFDAPVNQSLSVVHVPTSVFFRDKQVLHTVQWTQPLESVFITNYQKDPGLTWQYFGSSTGLMRHFPAMEWPVKEPIPDMFDCRLRSWYMEAAAGPKDVVILLDNSGSMRSESKIEISQLVVNTILETLGHNDFVNIIAFVNDTKFIVDCYKDSLVQANMENIRELKLALWEMDEPQNITNFDRALSVAFELLETYRTKQGGANCSQAIMLITDGVDSNYRSVFVRYNWQSLFKPVRVFTFLLSQEAADVEDIKWMACNNNGYYVHINTMGEVRDQVLKYIPVFARPMVLKKEDSPVIWTPFYADKEDPAMTDWLWNDEESKEQRERSMSFRQNYEKFTLPVEEEKRNINKLRRMQDQSAGDNKYRLMTSVAKAALDSRDKAKVKLGKDCDLSDPTCEETKLMKIAFILGVAGTDMTLDEIKQTLKPHWLGVNAYSFVVTNNGYVLMHPDLRPVFQGILKPGYNSVDVTDVELVDDGQGPLNFSQPLLEFRRKLVDGTTSSYTSLPIKHHYDNMKRVKKGLRYYYYKPIKNSPFTLVISLPDHYGHNQIKALISESNLQNLGKGRLNIFEGNWTVHPEWIYCKYRKKTFIGRPEKEVEHFFFELQRSNWQWPSPSSTDVECDQDLFLSLVHDAKATSWFSFIEYKGREFRQKFGLMRVFLATRSGLTRWHDFYDTLSHKDLTESMHFHDIPNQSIDEVWYQRAVEHNLEEPEKFVFSVPFNSGVLGPEIPMNDDILITASNAIFVDDGRTKAPAAVVGFQFLYSALHSLFINITHHCPPNVGSECRQLEHTCASPKLACYILDSNAYIILSEKKDNIGFFFGEVHRPIMEHLVAQNVFWRIHIYDYQGVCFVNGKGDETKNNCSPSIRNPFQVIGWFGRWLLANMLWVLTEFNIQWVGSSAVPNGEDFLIDEPSQSPTLEGFSNVKERLEKVMIKRTLPEPCTLEVDLYRATPEKAQNPFKPSPSLNKCDVPYYAQNIPNTDLLLVMVHTPCIERDFNVSLNVIPSEVKYEGTSFNCRRKDNDLPRRRPSICNKQHNKVTFI